MGPAEDTLCLAVLYQAIKQGTHVPLHGLHGLYIRLQL